MKNTGRLLLVVVPVLVILGLCAFLVVRRQFDHGIAPVPPVSSIPEESTAPPAPRTAQLQPTLLAPQPNDDGTSLPPGIEPDEVGPQTGDEKSSGNVIPIPDLQQPATLLEFPAPPEE